MTLEKDYKTIIIPKDHLKKYMLDKNVESQAVAMEQMRERMYEFLAERTKMKLADIKDNMIVKFEV